MIDGLTPRERECVALAAAGETNEQIAHDLCLGIETVRTHLNKAYRRLGLEDAGQPARVLAAVMWTRATYEDGGG